MTSFVPSAVFHSLQKVDVSLSVAADGCQGYLSRIGQLLEAGQLVPAPGLTLGAVNRLAVSGK